MYNYHPGLINRPYTASGEFPDHEKPRLTERQKDEAYLQRSSRFLRQYINCETSEESDFFHQSAFSVAKYISLEAQHSIMYEGDSHRCMTVSTYNSRFCSLKIMASKEMMVRSWGQKMILSQTDKLRTKLKPDSRKGSIPSDHLHSLDLGSFISRDVVRYFCSKSENLVDPQLGLL